MAKKIERDRNKVVEAVPLLPVRDVVIFPYMVVPLLVGRLKSVNALEEAMLHDRLILICTQKDPKVEEPVPEDISGIGTLSEILQLLKLPDGTAKILVEGLRRMRVKGYLPSDRFFRVGVEDVAGGVGRTPELEALMRAVQEQFEKYVNINPRIPPEILGTLIGVDEPGRFADIIVGHLPVKLQDRQKLLEAVNPKERLETLFGVLKSELEILSLEDKIQKKVLTKIGKVQKDYYLNEQLKAIQEELGEKGESNDVEVLRKQIKEAKMPQDIEEKALKELERLKQLFPLSPETAVIRNYLDWLAGLPWSKETEDKIDIDKAEKILEEDHYGLKKVKERILEYLAVRKLVDRMKGPILCFVGPPGTGKTSVGKSIARSLGRKFIRVSLGGIRDEAEIRGHRRTYVGALPGRIIQSIRKAQSKNPVFVFDEIDKLGVDFRGDPSSALLEALDPEQNNSFSDNYLEVPFDLSKVMFITTANTLFPVPAALRDRLEVIEFPGYTDEEKLHIAQRFLIPKELEAHGLNKDNLEMSKPALLRIIHEYTKEAGVRNLEREIANICRKAAKNIARKDERSLKLRIAESNVPKYLGPVRFERSKKEQKKDIGVVTGLAWTEAGGDILLAEAVVIPGKGQLLLTGQMGEVMQESAKAALSYIRSRTGMLGVKKDFYKKYDIHIHVPMGAIPKDGPSAGITLATAMVSALTKKPVSPDIAMTGEITLRGRVLPVGGIKEKVLAAHRAEIKTIIMSSENKKDLEDVPKNIMKQIKFRFVKNMDDVMKIAGL
ncbi:endopeptidase La [Candidatus Desantisbacteria bacterium CG_4_10_14_0_8_um_filter_48_22]|uniref:Lon protease n=1 Tax=Candidatus Desantisbacteria bacterium CG_4_10_14_0_8_um_filter_48_22 TaxID=1974543 RepID=A0A2M7SDT1_9BACT|nr:MAG: endopeptidase La [Candidatus Desantisbacteria bacterium CG_4_10_14_0_8_um_filter_48_22]